MNRIVAAMKAAFPHTIPVLTGFSFLGIAYGILMNTKGYGIGWTSLMSALVYAGSVQYVGITLLTSVFNPIYALALTLMINARHLFYGISMLEKYKDTGKFKPFLIFALCDETFSILCSTEPPEGIDRNWFFMSVTYLGYFYWLIGSMVGSLLGSMVTFDTKGLDFVLTALYVVIVIDQWKSVEKHTSALIGLGCTLVCLLVLGQDHFIIPAMGMILLMLTAFRERIEKEIDPCD